MLFLLLTIFLCLSNSNCGRSVTFTKIDHPTVVLTSNPNSILIEALDNTTNALSLPASSDLTFGFEERSGQDAHITKLRYKVYGAKDEQILLDGSNEEKSIVVGGNPAGLKVEGNSRAAATTTFMVDSVEVGSLAELLDLSDGVGGGCGKGTLLFRAEGYDNDGLPFFSTPLYVQLTIIYKKPCA